MSEEELVEHMSRKLCRERGEPEMYWRAYSDSIEVALMCLRYRLKELWNKVLYDLGFRGW